MYTLSVLSGQSPLEILIPEMLYNLTLPILMPKHNIRKSDSVEGVIFHHRIYSHILKIQCVAYLYLPVKGIISYDITCKTGVG